MTAIMNAATVLLLLVFSCEVRQPCLAFVPVSRTSASITSSSSSSFSVVSSTATTLLHVTSSPPPPPTGSPSAAEVEKDENQSTPLFTLDDDTTSIQDEDIDEKLYQVEENHDEPPPPMSDLPLPGSPSLPQVDTTMPVSEFVDEETTNEDFSFYMRDEDDMLTEREDRLYSDDNGVRRKIERCILVGVEDLAAQRKARKDDLYYDPLSSENEPPCFTLDESMIEMRELIKTAGLSLEAEIIQRQKEVNPRTYIGSGKVEEARLLMEKEDCCTIVFDAELSPGQQKTLENIFNKEVIQNDFLGSQDQDIKVIDRTALILDIFAQHAKTREGKLQVDLALHEFRKPRLTKMWTHLERQSGAGGVGLRGPGESQLEIDRRLVRDRIIVLKRKIDDVQKQRTIHRRGRKRTGLPLLSLVGYTNAGKSSVLNQLTRAGVMAESMLFATLDPTTRKVKLPGESTHPEFLLTDTVGFIQKLPTNLVAAFRATLEEVEEADVLVHVIDVANPSWEKQERAVIAVLSDMGVCDKPIVRVLNKIDLLDDEEAEMVRYEAAYAENTVAVSALYGEGMEDFVESVEDALNAMLVSIELVIPYSKGQALSLIHETGVVETIDYQADGTYVLGRVPQATANRLQKYSLIPVGKNADDKECPETTTTKTSTDDEIDWVALGRGRHSKD
jgi:GTP-binding protein HflX